MSSLIKYDKSYPSLNLSGEIKQSSEDFVVEEIISFEPTGEGEHLFLWVQKRNQNTTWLAKQIARWAKVEPRKVNFGGLKDRYAITRQWFSIYLPGKADPDLEKFKLEGCEILKTIRHNKALKHSALRGNLFTIKVSNLALNNKPLQESDLSNIINRIELLKTNGIPNYFGEQRFGIDAGNLDVATRLFEGNSDD
ncbi:MAG: tRNA pseudouridine(13) synthase TruD, partial [Saccharospirillaceae bacterium]|nr:tRNA pseudouridine(13) synthase TruD [Pseudomonadales bacterium]NRB81705.1 tRNA pseudouridine(13) synthase TruD [Saccharospirillaceae bacterium]